MSLPTFFLSHGSPMLALTDTPAHRFLQNFASTIARPRAVLVVSAHFETEQPTVVADPHPEMIYDFRGFPRPLYEINYPAPGDAAVAAEVADELRAAGLPVDVAPKRGFDHGTWIPLSLVWPDADVPLVQLSIQPHRDAAHHLALGRAIAALREQDVLVIGTGAATHNLRVLFRNPGGMPAVDAEPVAWAREFADWVADTAAAGDADALVDYRARAPHAVMAHPEDDHFMPFFVALGAAGEGAKGERIHNSYEYSALSMDMYRFG
ncbi:MULTISPECIES: DODA-type extradiol aromatic ring-opening family dioxygenase [Kaistia]|uniref:Class III extradiol ring-cleavage dioxygenase n=1 Tax=Kaistia nematophila TaxID=2994654 RepID=A0A9X3ILS3_9HYPH|nr:class III extradiol ring-cleavage dioxygenase [Kaistia nematophila]MBN9027062.1 dioxygenase [Hyphomicrobiales bacterium]MCX5569135.1 class III extradiol ring-cleavage dioxygenase [Kaistia nematophila]